MAKRATPVRRGQMAGRAAAEAQDRPGGVEQAGAGRAPMDADPGAAARARVRAAARAAEAIGDGAGGATGQASRRQSTERQPFGMQEQQMLVAPIPGFRQYWFNDTPGRIARAVKAGYSHVIDPETDEPKRMLAGRHESRPEGMQAYLMKIPQEWYDEDHGAAADALAARLDDIRTGRGQGENQYVQDRHRVENGSRR
ncbi:MAG TPA: hypothetical protein VMV33_17180 [Rhodocyclaceae bacterium]|nr:hypothetical protein [Rhodocyclaceae bacterium]